MLQLPKSELIPNKTVLISGSKSESNRLLILQKLMGNLEIKNLSNAQDTDLLKKALSTDNEIIDIHHAGTAMRFLTSYFAIQENKTTILTGSERMKERPIHHLVTALTKLGADIEYLENDGFPPLRIKGKKLNQDSIEIPANISSQFISSLLLIGSKLDNGLEINLIGTITSKPYIEMTLEILSKIGIKNHFSENTIKIEPLKNKIQNKEYIVESDWSSASYFYSMAAIGRKNIILKSFNKNSLQGDSCLTKIYHQFFGIQTFFNDKSIELRPLENFIFPKKIELNMNDCPDIAQTLCVTASALKIPFKIIGLETLKVKETDRLIALQNELIKIGAKTEITENCIHSIDFSSSEKNIFISTYNDHRMAMSFAPFSLIKEIQIQNPNVVEKSYPNFWKDFFSITQSKL